MKEVAEVLDEICELKKLMMNGSIGYILLTVAVLWGIANPIYAQRLESTDSIPDQKELWKEFQKLQKDYNALQKDIASLQDKLNKDKANKRIISLNQTIDSLNNVILSDKELISKLTDEYQVKQDSIYLLNAELQPLLVFRKAFVMNLFKESEEYLKLPYSQISTEKLNQLKDNLSEYSSDKEVRIAISSIDKAILNASYMTEMKLALESPFDIPVIIKARELFTNLKSKKKDFSDAQWKEFETLDKYLSRYYSSVKAFQTMIKKNNGIIDQYGAGSLSTTLRDDCIEEIKTVFNQYEEKEIRKGINVIPYLKSRFEEYRKWAVSNPLNKKDNIIRIESEILKLKLTR